MLCYSYCNVGRRIDLLFSTCLRQEISKTSCSRRGYILMPFSWQERKKLARETMYRRCVQDCDNPDFKAKHPELAKELMTKSIINKVETLKYVNKIMDKKLHFSEKPKSTVVPKRYNRVQ